MRRTKNQNKKERYNLEGRIYNCQKSFRIKIPELIKFLRTFKCQNQFIFDAKLWAYSFCFFERNGINELLLMERIYHCCIIIYVENWNPQNRFKLETQVFREAWRPSQFFDEPQISMLCRQNGKVKVQESKWRQNVKNMMSSCQGYGATMSNLWYSKMMCYDLIGPHR